MYIEYKGEGIVGPARIGRVTFSKTGQSVYYRGRSFTTLSGRGFKANYSDDETGDHYWISGCKKDGTDALYSTTVEIDEDVREEYWTQIRTKPEMKAIASVKCPGKHSKRRGSRL
ncbi:MAG TPA: 1-deoxy-D-xylulose-5-phosphate synthase [Blastocatellia bacterium]|nr:1-deoxy-D-xylulose-5-phosphate synthase [Blastocatellia bacterium]